MKSGDRYSRTVALLKVLFPVTALALLSTLFLISRGNDSDAPIPFADKEIQDRLRDQQITGPFFSGSTADGDLVSFYATKLTTPDGRTGDNRAEDVMAQIETVHGATLRVQANLATVDIASDLTELTGSVIINTSSGYKVTTDALLARMSELSLEAPGTVIAVSPMGTLTAGNMTVTKPKTADHAQMLFSGGVKLLYTPN